MENPNGEPERILLEDLPKEYHRLSFLVDTGDENIKREEEISIKAGEVVAELERGSDFTEEKVIGVMI